MIRGMLVKDGKLTEVELDGSLDAYYEALDCDCIDIVPRYIGGHLYGIVCDDEGMFREVVEISMINERTRLPMLVGALFICNLNGDELDSLLDDDIQLIRSKFKHQVICGDI